MPLTIDDVVRLDEIDADIEAEDMTAYGIADLIWMRGLLQQALAERDMAVEALRRIVQWSEAYPLDIFPEPDWAYVRVLLGHAGITVDAVSASCMRRVVEGVGKIAREALEE